MDFSSNIFLEIVSDKKKNVLTYLLVQSKKKKIKKYLYL